MSCYIIFITQKMITFNEVTGENRTENNAKWTHVLEHPYRILIFGNSGSGKTNTFLNLTNCQTDIGKIYLYVKDPYEAKYPLLIKKRRGMEE